MSAAGKHAEAQLEEAARILENSAITAKGAVQISAVVQSHATIGIGLYLGEILQELRNIKEGV
jgi:hypothetical protein